MKTVLELARVAGVRDDGHRFEFSEYKYLELFVALIRADERELVLAAALDGAEHAARKAVADEREACAGLAERRMLTDENKNRKTGYDHACKVIAAAIRARGNT